MNTLTIKNIVFGEGMPKIIIPLMGTTDKELLSEVKAVKGFKPDVIEWRADVYEQLEDIYAVQSVLSKLRLELNDLLLLFTFRSHKEGGAKKITNEYYKKLAQTVIQTGHVDMIDIELFMDEAIVQELVTCAHENGVFVIMSNHDFQKTPSKEEIIARLRQMQVLGADMPKIAVMPNNVEDVLKLLDATHTMKEKYADRPFITMSMAGTGLISRLAGEVFGSAATFGAGINASAPGQIPASELKKVLEIIHKNM
ncbi:MAG: type I 3-dehydroquinate dehydratase [Tuberibacillus sp.]